MEVLRTVSTSELHDALRNLRFPPPQQRRSSGRSSSACPLGPVAVRRPSPTGTAAILQSPPSVKARGTVLQPLYPSLDGLGGDPFPPRQCTQRNPFEPESFDGAEFLRREQAAHSISRDLSGHATPEFGQHAPRRRVDVGRRERIDRSQGERDCSAATACGHLNWPAEDVGCRFNSTASYALEGPGIGKARQAQVSSGFLSNHS